MKVITSNPVLIQGVARKKAKKKTSKFSDFDANNFADVLKFQTWVNNVKKPFVPLPLNGRYDGITDGAYKQYGKEYEMSSGQPAGSGLKNPDLFDRTGKFQEYKEKMKKFFQPSDPLPQKANKPKPKQNLAPAKEEEKGMSTTTIIVIVGSVTLLLGTLLLVTGKKLKTQRA